MSKNKKQVATPPNNTTTGKSTALIVDNKLDLSSVKRYVPKQKSAMASLKETVQVNSENGIATLKDNKLKTPKSVLCFIPPEEVWDSIQEIRNKYANVARWPQPHICLLYPFVPVELFDEAESVLIPSLSKIKPFEVTLSKFGYFDTIGHLSDKGQGTIHFEPDKVSYEQMKIVQKTCFDLFPYCNALTKRGPFRPHLSVGVFDSTTLQDTMKQFKTEWKDLTFTLDHVCLMSRVDNDSPFVISHRIPFLGKE